MGSLSPSSVTPLLLYIRPAAMTLPQPVPIYRGLEVTRNMNCRFQGGFFVEKTHRLLMFGHLSMFELNSLAHLGGDVDFIQALFVDSVEIHVKIGDKQR
jgi:hypothetical protein